MAFKDIMGKIGGAVKGAAGAGMLGPVGMLAGKLLGKKGMRVKKGKKKMMGGGKMKYKYKKGGSVKRDMFTQQYD
tara:strand:- start:436 stop:660 length:225 start_codon:yes stop_codon:yes gene_type:complete